MAAPTRSSSMRWIILALTVVVAVFLYLDRYCLGFVLPFVRENYRLSDSQSNFLVGAFFYTYAFAQIAGGYLSDRFGTRLMLSLYFLIWSILTGVTGLATGFVVLIMLRFGCGLFEAGAYPACAGMIRRWFPYERRGLASGIVSIGGRIGGTIAPLMTGYLMVVFMPLSHPSLITDHDLLKPRKLSHDALLIPEKNKKLLPMFAANMVGLSGTPIGAGPLLACSSAFSGATDKKLSPVLVHCAWHLQSKLPERGREVFHDLASLPTKVAPTVEQQASLSEALNDWVMQRDLMNGLDLAPIETELSKEMRLRFEPTNSSRSAEQVARDNRLLLEFLFPGSLRQLHGDAWQPVLMIYGAVGAIMALVFFAFYRDSPRQHFLANEAEAELAEAHETAGGDGAAVSTRSLWIGILTSVGLWASSLVQFGTNFGWIFLGSMLPTYLQRVYPQVSLIERGWMAMLPFLVAVPMMIFGGWWTDRLARRYGTYWGRCVPIASTRFLAATAFLACCFLDSPWAITFVLCAFSIASDSGVPAIWAYNLDVGKRNVGLVLGWGNMWGNLGAAVAPTILGDYVLTRFVDFDGSFTLEEARAGYNAVFATCAAVFVVIGVVAFFIDASRPIGAKRATEN